jgi:hypothetical protein
MGRRSRRRAGDAAIDRPSLSAEASDPEGPVASARGGSGAARPKAPWHPFPLVELCALAGLVLIGVGVVLLPGRNGGGLIACGLVLGSLAGLDTVGREHFAGFKSHALLLAGVPAVLVAGVLSFARAPIVVIPVVAVVVFGGAFVGFRRTFRRRSPGPAHA